MSDHGPGMRLTDPKAGDWDYDGSCVNSQWADTVSLGIFQWVPRANNSGRLKRGKVVKRIKGPRGSLPSLRLQAEAWIAKQEAAK
jgi:hypothetical protein